MSSHAELEQRLARYADLRDAGIHGPEAAFRVGVIWHGAGRKYERWYQETRRPAPRPGPSPRWTG